MLKCIDDARIKLKKKKLKLLRKYEILLKCIDHARIKLRK